jgi:hypothetical protein
MVGSFSVKSEELGSGLVTFAFSRGSDDLCFHSSKERERERGRREKERERERFL